MQVQSFSKTGSIRDDNQDHLLVDSELRFALIADGHGPDGRAAAMLTASTIHQRLSEIAPVTGDGESLHRLREAYELAQKACNEQFTTQSRCDIAAAWTNRGTVAIFATGACRLLSTQSDTSDWLEQREIEMPAHTGMSLLLTSEGTAAALSSQQLQPALNILIEQSDATGFEAFSQQTTAVYDGDDCSAILLKLETADLTAGNPHEIELFEHYNREYSFKLWMPLSLAGCIGLAAVAAAIKLKPVIDRLKS
ncbi:MAG: hypothetical protein KKB51_19840 [Candidatus Riflebacteria bacterium]|nr:hypothetical protein [Candidatus Riflebacteria bacterium]